MTQPQKKDPIQTIHAIMVSQKAQIEAALPNHLTANRMLRITLTELRRTPKLLMCDPLSILGAVVLASQFGLEPGGVLGHCWLIPYSRECQLQIGYRGMVDLARRSGNVLSIEARCIYDGDVFDVALGTESSITHRPLFKSTTITYAYAVAKLRGGGTQFDIMPIEEINKIRDNYSQSYKRDPKNSPWATATDEMAKKTVVRRLFKMLPTSVEIRDAMSVDEDDDQHNAKVIDANYEVVPAALDPSLIIAEQTEGAKIPPIKTGQDISRADKERQVAMEIATKEFERVMNEGGDPFRVLGINDGVSFDEYSTDALNIFGDKLRNWRKK